MAFNKRIGSDGDVGIWHETYLVPAGRYDCVYNNMPPIGLGMATSLVPAAGRKATAAGRAASATVLSGGGPDRPHRGLSRPAATRPRAGARRGGGYTRARAESAAIEGELRADLGDAAIDGLRRALLRFIEREGALPEVEAQRSRLT